ncbi:nidogen-like domain-containing protein [Aliagarivorans marinus]|uniref:nidogen-like domain-containing protein n=1 Tax=Aliagarivorans marinus TaxID=561965 RepID=UPI00041748E7|nr:nidogen-like domain-containing protein [Aliagarivorans marinus]
MKTASGLLAACLMVALPLSVGQAAMMSGFGGDAGYGELAMQPNDDGSSNRLNLPFEINYFGNSYDSFFVNNNGNISFNSSLNGYTPQHFPVANQPIIAPFWADVDTRCGDCGAVYVGAPNENSVAITWDQVGYYNHHGDKTNSFQLVLIDRSDTGAGNFDVEFRYDNLSWTTGDASDGSNGFGGTPAQAGYDAGNGSDFFSLPGSFSEDILNLTNTSNTGINGVWRFAIRDGALPGATPENPLMPVVVDGGWEFDFNVDLDQIVFIDPDVAVGYDYFVDAGPNFLSVILPEGFDDNLFELWLMNEFGEWVMTDILEGGIEYLFGEDGVSEFRILGIDIDNMLDPEDMQAFVTGLSFVDAGMVSMRQIPVTEFVPAGNVSEPYTKLLILLVLAVIIANRKVRIKPYQPAHPLAA